MGEEERIQNQNVESTWKSSSNSTSWKQAYNKFAKVTRGILHLNESRVSLHPFGSITPYTDRKTRSL